MRICMVGDYSDILDEGLKNIAFHLAEEISRNHEVLKLDLGGRTVSNVRRVSSRSYWNKVREFDPDLIHYVPGRTTWSFVLLKTLSSLTGAKTVISAFHPNIRSVSDRLVLLLRPDLVLVQSDDIERKFANLGLSTAFLPNGVDTEKFVPVSSSMKRQLRAKYRIDPDKFVILHVGHLTEARNLLIYHEIQNDSNQVIIVGSFHAKMNELLCQQLMETGCKIWRRYFEKIEEVYELSDCYVFPVMDGNTISTPLSVLEAMSCNLSVITNRSGGLNETFEAGSGLSFAEKDEDFIRILERIRSEEEEVQTRKKVAPFSWKSTADRLAGLYCSIM